MNANRAFLVVLLVAGFIAALLMSLPVSLTASASVEEHRPACEHSQPQDPRTEAGDGRPLQVLTGLQSTYSLAQELVRGTGITVVPLFPEHVRMEAQHRYLAENVTKVGQNADRSVAAVTIRSVWRADPLFAAVRSHNIRLIEIDACEPIEPDGRSVALIDTPSEAAPAHSRPNTLPYVWLSLANATRMAEILAEDLARIAPNDAARIKENLAGLKREVFSLRSDYQAKFAECEVLEAVALCSDFVYLTGEFQIEVVDYRLKPEIRWSAEDCREFTRFLRERQVRVVIHKWTPQKPVLDAIHTGGATLVILHTMDPPVSDGSTSPGLSYLKVMEENVRCLYEAFTNARTAGYRAS